MVESHPSFPRQSQKSIALLPILSKFSMYDVKMLNESCSEFGDTHLRVEHGFIVQACPGVTYPRWNGSEKIYDDERTRKWSESAAREII